jgi:hypothetical protein
VLVKVRLATNLAPEDGPNMSKHCELQGYPSEAPMSAFGP